MLSDRFNNIVKWILLSSIKIYRKLISPALPRCCRFYPTCSQYAVQAIDRYGPYKGAWISVKRILRCHPFHPGGYDPLI